MNFAAFGNGTHIQQDVQQTEGKHKHDLLTEKGILNSLFTPSMQMNAMAGS